MNKILKKLPLYFSIFLLFSCARGINKNFQTVKIHTKLPYTVISEKTISKSKKVFETNKYDTLTIKRSANPISFKVLVADSSQNIYIKPKISPLIYLNLPTAFIGTIGTIASLRFSTEFDSIKWLIYSAFGYGGLIGDLKSEKKYTYPHNIYIYEQNNKAYYLPFDKKILQQKNAIKISPLRIVDQYTPSYELAYERKLTKAFTAQFLYAKMNKNPVKIGIENSFNGKRFGYELRYFLKKTAPIGTYIALDHNRLSQNYTEILYFSKNNLADNYISYADSVKINRQLNSVNIKVGYQYIKNHFLFDFGFGLGKRIETLKHFGRINEADLPNRNGFFRSNNRNGQFQSPNLPITFKLGYSF